MSATRKGKQKRKAVPVIGLTAQFASKIIFDDPNYWIGRMVAVVAAVPPDPVEIPNELIHGESLRRSKAMAFDDLRATVRAMGRHFEHRMRQDFLRATHGK